MDKRKKNNKKVTKCEKQVTKSNQEEYSYDFVPHLNEWTNIDEQKKTVKKLEDISKDK